jgi:hypothetical protein
MDENVIYFLGGIFLTLFLVASITWITKPKAPLEAVRDSQTNYLDIVSKTEYYANETGQIIVRLSKGNGDPLTGSCNGTIVYPNKTIWILDYPLISSSILGNYYTTVTIPDVLGVYEYSFACFVNPSGQILTKSSSFHVSIAYQKFQEIINMLNNMNSTIGNITFNTTDLEINMANNFTYTNNLINQLNQFVNNSFINVNNNIFSLNTTINDFRSYLTIRLNTIETKIDNIVLSINNLINSISNGFTNFINNLVGNGNSLQPGAVTQGSCSFGNRLLGLCP